MFSATKQIMRMLRPQSQKHHSQWEEVTKCNFKSKAQVHEKCFFLMKWQFLQCRDRFSGVLSFFAEKSHFRLNAQNHFFRASKNPILCLVATKQIMRNAEATDAQKHLSQWEKVAKCILRAKAQGTWKMFLSNEMNSFFAMQKTDFHEFELFCRKSHFRA